LNAAGRLWRTARFTVRLVREERRDPMPAVALAIVWLIVGDDVVLWCVGQLSDGLRTSAAEWGEVPTTLLFGALPVVSVAVLVLRPFVSAAWRRAAKPLSSTPSQGRDAGP
jgi:hypothetical protein